MSIDSRYKIPADATANVHSVSAIGEQYLDLVSTGNPGQYLRDGQNVGEQIGRTRCRARSVRRWTPPTAVWPCCPRRRSTSCSPKPRKRSAGWGPALQRLVDSTTNIAQGFKDNLPQVNDIIAHSAPILDSQVNSGDNIEQWSRNLNIIAAQSAEQDAALRSGLQQAAPTLDQVTAVFSDVRDALPQTLANLAVVIDMLKRYHKGLEQTLVILPQGAAVGAGGHAVRRRGSAAAGALDQPAAAVLDRLPSGFGVAVARRHQHGAAAHGYLLQDSKGLPGQRGSRCAQLSLRGCAG